MAIPSFYFIGVNMIKNKDMVFDSETRRYILSIDYVQNNLGVDLQVNSYDEFDSNPTTLPDRILQRVSDNVYEFLKLKSKDYYFACERIEDEVETNNAFRDCMRYQLEDFMLSGDRALLDNPEFIGARVEMILNANGLLTRRRKPSFSIRGDFNVGNNIA